MAFLRFSRDKRGYEHTALVEATKRHGHAETRVLYFFRTPPYVKVGRSALDEDTMRMIEERYPDVSFDWGRILRDPPQTMPEDQALRRREHRDARDAKRKKKRPAETDTKAPETSTADPYEPVDAESVETSAAEELIESAPEPPAVIASPASEVLGVEAAAHLRNRFVVLMQRVDRVSDEAKRDSLRKEAARLDPSQWATAEAVREAMDAYEALYEAVRAQVGGGRRRRRRRRGRGKPDGEAPPSTGV